MACLSRTATVLGVLHVTSDAAINESPETGLVWRAFPLSCFGRNPEGVGCRIGELEFLLANVSLAVGRDDCCGCLLSKWLSAYSDVGIVIPWWNWKATGLIGQILLEIRLLWGANHNEKDITLTEFRKAAPSTAQSSGQSLTSCILSMLVPNLVRDCVLSLAGLSLRLVLMIWLICSRACSVTIPE